MKITPKIDDRKSKRKLNQQLREQPRQVQIALGRTAEFLLGMIKKRTQKGKDLGQLSVSAFVTKIQSEITDRK